MRTLLTRTFQRIRHSAFVKLGLKLGLTFAALWFVFHQVDFERLGTLFEKQHKWLLIYPLLFLTVQALLGGLRWRVVLSRLYENRHRLFSRAQAIRIGYIGNFFNNCLPGGTVGGDAVRVWITRAHDVPLSISIHSVIIDRIIALVALVIMVLVALPWLGDIAGFNGAVLLPALVALMVMTLWGIRYLKRYMERYSETIPLLSQLFYFSDNLKSLVLSPRTLVVVLAFGTVGHITFCLAMVYIAKSLGIHLSLYNSLVLVPPVALISTLPISVGGWGVRELAMIFMLGLVGIGQEEALVLSLEAGVIGIITSMPGGLFWLFERRRDKGKVTGVMTP